MMIACAHADRKRFGKDRHGGQRWRCLACGKAWSEARSRPLGGMTISVDGAKLALRLLVEGSSLHSTARVTKLQRNMICKLLVYFGEACQRFLDGRMRGLTLDHLQFDEQWTFVLKKQARLTKEMRKRRHDIGDIYVWTCVDQSTKLMPSFMLGKRSSDMARRFMLDVARRLKWPNPHASDDHAYRHGAFHRIVQISTHAFADYPEAVDLAFGPYVKYGTIMKEYRNSKIIYTPSDMVGAKQTARRGMSEGERWTICTSSG